jgi:uncharacterized protein
MKNLFVFLFFLGLSGIGTLKAQSSPPAPHRIVFQLVSADTVVHKALMKQLANLLSLAPTAEIEVVCHGPGLEMLVASQSKVAGKLEGFRKQGIAFVGCEFSMRDRKIDKSMLLPSAGTVPAAILEIVMKQEQGWSYIKAGF